MLTEFCSCSQLRLVANTIAHSCDCLADAPNGRYWTLSNASISTSITRPVMPWLSSMKQTPSRACVNAPVRLPAPGNAPDTWPQSGDFTGALSPEFSAEIGRAHVGTPVTNAQLESRIRVGKK